MIFLVLFGWWFIGAFGMWLFCVSIDGIITRSDVFAIAFLGLGGLVTAVPALVFFLLNWLEDRYDDEPVRWLSLDRR